MPEFADMKLFVHAVLSGSLSAAGRELGFSPAVGSKRLARLEAELGTRLIQRTSRRLKLTEEGTTYFEYCRNILAQIEAAQAEVGRGKHQPNGLLRVSSPIALGRRWVGPALANFAAAHPQLRVQLSLSDAVVDLVEQGFDCAVRVGTPADSRLVTRKLAENRRIVCASPEYIQRRGEPHSPAELHAHDCIVMSPNPISHTHWSFHDRRKAATRTTVRVQPRLVTDSGEQAHDWALAGLGLQRRSVWDVAQELADGRLVEVLRGWVSDPAPICVVYATKQHLPARTRLFVDSLIAEFAQVKSKRSPRGWLSS